MNLNIFLKKVNIIQGVLLRLRNKIKRYIRSAYTDIEDDINTCCNLLIVWKKSISHEKANYFDIKNELISILKSSNNIEERI